MLDHSAGVKREREHVYMHEHTGSRLKFAKDTLEMHDGSIDELSKRVERLNRRYEMETGKQVTNFFCPILMQDGPGELCKGHVIPANLGVSGIWVPQRKDVDSFYGRSTEATFGAVMNNFNKTAVQIWANKETNRLFKPKLKHKGEIVQHFFLPETKQVSISEQHCVGEVVGDEGETISRVVVKKSDEEMRFLHGEALQIVIESNPSPMIVASLIKAAHLTMFSMLDYSHVFSPSGKYLSGILSDFFNSAKELPNHELENKLQTTFSSTARSMIYPLQSKLGRKIEGTITSKNVLACLAGSGGIFALGILIQTPSQTFCVFVPTEFGSQIDTYFSFLNEPPPSIRVKELHLKYGQFPEWNIDKSDPITIPLLR